MLSSSDDNIDVYDLLDSLEKATVTKTEKPWGVEYAFMLGDALCKVIIVNDGERTSLQSHRVKEEVTLQLDGDGGVFAQELIVTDDGSKATMNSRSGANRTKPDEVHRTIGPCILFEVQTNHPDDVVRYADDYGR